MDTPLWCCPLCREPLHDLARGLGCTRGHRFDRAREGYVNLLPANRRHSASPGDSRAMLRSRRAFLEAGHYLPLAERIAALFVDHLAAPGRTAANLLDAGCGEGWYTGHLQQALRRALPAVALRIGGLDIAKEAARMAARRHPDVQFAVASNARLPVDDAVLDGLLRVFAPGDDREPVRVLAAGGLLLAVTPGERHLFGLRRLVYDHPRARDSSPRAIPGLAHVRRERLEYRLHLAAPGEAGRLLAMTPFYWQASPDRQAQVASLAELETEVDFCLDLYRKPEPH